MASHVSRVQWDCSGNRRTATQYVLMCFSVFVPLDLMMDINDCRTTDTKVLHWPFE